MLALFVFSCSSFITQLSLMFELRHEDMTSVEGGRILLGRRRIILITINCFSKINQ